MSTPMIDRAMRQIVDSGCEPTDLEIIMGLPKGPHHVEIFCGDNGQKETVIEISKEAANDLSRSMLLHSIITGLENLAEDATEPQVVLAAIDAVRRIK